jgi:hypothetical protein
MPSGLARSLSVRDVPDLEGLGSQPGWSCHGCKHVSIELGRAGPGHLPEAVTDSFRTYMDPPVWLFRARFSFAKVIITRGERRATDRNRRAVITIEIPDSDRRVGGLAPERLQAALDALRVDGVVVLADVVDLEHIDALHERMVSDLVALQARPDAPYNWTAGNIQQDPPPFKPYLFADVLLNPQVIEVTSSILGPGLKNIMYSGNTALPSDARQPVHADAGHLWPAEILETPHPTAQLVVNVPTVDVSAENGATEIWLGTHRELTVGVGSDIEVPLDALERRREIAPPIQPEIQRGSVVIRDIRLWHAGMPNHTDKPRPMIAMLHSSSWLEVGSPLEFPTGTETFFEHPLLTTAARFTGRPTDHIHRSHGFRLVEESIG